MGSLPLPGDERLIFVDAKVDGLGAIDNVAYVTTSVGDPNPDNDDDTVQVIAQDPPPPVTDDPDTDPRGADDPDPPNPVPGLGPIGLLAAARLLWGLARREERRRSDPS